MTAVAVAVCLLAMRGQGEVAEYAFKHTKAARFIETRWRDLKVMLPELQMANSVQDAPKTGPWVWVDREKNRLVFGSRDDSAGDLAKMMAEFDVAPFRIELKVRVSHKEWGIVTSGILSCENNERMLFGSREMGCLVEFKPRLDTTGLVRVDVSLTSLPSGEKVGWCRAQIDVGGRSTFQVLEGAGALVGEKVDPKAAVLSPPSGAGWKPFTIDVAVTAATRPVEKR